MFFRPNESCKRHVSVARFLSAFLELHIFAVLLELEVGQSMLQRIISSLFSFLSCAIKENSYTTKKLKQTKGFW